MALEKTTEMKHDSKNKKHRKAVASKNRSEDRLVCVSCGMAIEINYPLTETKRAEAEKASGFQPQSHRMILYGYCQDCTRNLN
jgi:Fur family transcriptional regulator, ferric uptake regulator